MQDNMTVKRFKPVASAAISLSENGDYVRYEDYAALAAKYAGLEALEVTASLPGGSSAEEARSLHADLVRSHISKALSGEKMKPADKDADLRWIHGVIVRAAWFVKASVEAAEIVKGA